MSQERAEQVVRSMWNRLRLIGWISNAVGGVVVFVAVGYLFPIFFDEAQREDLFWENLPFGIALWLIAGLIITWLSERNKVPAFGWALERREPDRDEQRRALKWPARQALMSIVGWTTGGLILALLNLDHSVGLAVLILISMWAGGEATAAVVYLLSERAQRPVTALALASRPSERAVAPGIRVRLLFAWSLGTGIPIIGVVAVGIAGATKEPAIETGYVAAACVFLGAVALVVGLLATVISARAIADPVAAVRDGLARVADGELDVEVPIDDASEVGQLQAGFNQMAEGLRERERIREMFGRQVGQEVARAALRDGTRLGGEEREIGALFVDLVGSTSMALAMPPAEVVRLLNRFFRVVIEVVEEEHGFVNKFEGDAALCVFGAPLESPDPAGQALCAARRMAARLDREVPEIGFGIGVSAGRAVAGNVGSELRFEYTVIGDPVNEAARLSDLAKERGQQVVASDAALTRASDGERDAWETGESTVLRGRLEATRLASPR